MKKNKILRLHLDDFINRDIEDNILEFLKIIKNNIDSSNFDIVFWYNNIKTSQLKEFDDKHKKIINELNIKILPIHEHRDFTWYDIISKTDEEFLMHYKFRSTYDNSDDILSCLIEFSNMLKFDNKKNSYNRGNYKDAKNRNNGV